MRKIFLCLFLISFSFACSEDDSRKDSSDSFDRKAMLTNWADNFIIPEYTEFEARTESLHERAEILAVNESISESFLQKLRLGYTLTYKNFQRISMFEIGEAENLNFRSFANTYPTDVNKIENAIETGTYNLELPSLRDAQGLPALDYLLYGVADSDDEIVAFYNEVQNPVAAKYKAYIVKITERLHTMAEKILADWNNGFRDSFVNNTSSSSTGSVDILANDFILHYEKFLRTGKIGIPAGAFTGNTEPSRVESFYNPNFSQTLFNENLHWVRDFFNGNYDENKNGPSFAAYLDYLNADKNGAILSEEISYNFVEVFEVTDEFTGNFVEQIESDNTKMLSVFDKLQQNVVLIKVDMFQALSISVDYVDTDGD